jgi:hypothetical protein
MNRKNDFKFNYLNLIFEILNEGSKKKKKKQKNYYFESFLTFFLMIPDSKFKKR